MQITTAVGVVPGPTRVELGVGDANTARFGLLDSPLGSVNVSAAMIDSSSTVEFVSSSCWYSNRKRHIERADLAECIVETISCYDTSKWNDTNMLMLMLSRPIDQA